MDIGIGCPGTAAELNDIIAPKKGAVKLNWDSSKARGQLIQSFLHSFLSSAQSDRLLMRTQGMTVVVGSKPKSLSVAAVKKI